MLRKRNQDLTTTRRRRVRWTTGAGAAALLAGTAILGPVAPASASTRGCEGGVSGTASPSNWVLQSTWDTAYSEQDDALSGVSMSAYVIGWTHVGKARKQEWRREASRNCVRPSGVFGQSQWRDTAVWRNASRYRVCVGIGVGPIFKEVKCSLRTEWDSGTGTSSGHSTFRWWWGNRV